MTFALTEGLNSVAAEYLLNASKNVLGEGKWRDGIRTIAQTVSRENPERAYRLFSDLKDEGSKDALYKELIGNFSLDNLDLLFKLAEEKRYASGGFEEYQRRYKEVVNKALTIEGRDEAKVGDVKLGKYLYRNLVNEHFTSDDKINWKAKIESEDVLELERLAVLHVDKFNLIIQREGRNIYAPLRLKWAQARWKEDPLFAYSLFIQLNYDGKEVVTCAKTAFEKMYSKDSSVRREDRIGIRDYHIDAFYDDLSKKDLTLRKIAARDSRDKSKLAKLARSSETRKDYKEAYDLAFEAGLGENDALVERARAQLYSESINEARKRSDRGRISFYWLKKEDRVGHEFVYDRVIRRRPGTAFTIAKAINDEPRMERSRAAILEKHEPKEALRFFSDEVKDRSGYERALGLLATQYGTTQAELMLLAPYSEK